MACCVVLLLWILATSVKADDEVWKLVWSDEFNGQQLDYSKWDRGERVWWRKQ